MRPLARSAFLRLFTLALLVPLAGCAIAPPRTDDPYQNFNRKMFAFNQKADKAVIRPVAVAYTRVTNETTRTLISNFFSNLRSPITIINDALQGRGGAAVEATGRFVVNTTVGVLGLFDPATRMKLPPHSTDFGVTLARWGVPDGPYLVLPFLGPTTLRDVWGWPVDSYLDPLAWYARENSFDYAAEYYPSLFYFVTLRASVLNIDSIINSAYDPYAFLRDAYRQRRLYMIYYGSPPLSVIEQLQGAGGGAESNADIDQLLQQQQEYEKTHGISENPSASPSSAPPSSAPPSSSKPAPASSAFPASASSGG